MSHADPSMPSDLDADGDGEPIVTTGFSIQDQAYFVDRSRRRRVLDRTDRRGGAQAHVEAGIVPGQPLTTSVGGDAGYSAWIRCEGDPSAPVLVSTSVDSVGRSDQPWLWHEVKLRFGVRRRFRRHRCDGSVAAAAGGPGADPLSKRRRAASTSPSSADRQPGQTRARARSAAASRARSGPSWPRSSTRQAARHERPVAVLARTSSRARPRGSASRRNTSSR